MSCETKYGTDELGIRLKLYIWQVRINFRNEIVDQRFSKKEPHVGIVVNTKLENERHNDVRKYLQTFGIEKFLINLNARAVAWR